MKDRNLEGTNKLEGIWDENDILKDDMSSMSNMSNMVSMSSIYMPTTPSIPINSTDVISQRRRKEEW